MTNTADAAKTIATSTIPSVTGGHIVTGGFIGTSGTKIVAETPLSLEAAQEALILRHVYLADKLPAAKDRAEKAMAEHRSIRMELDQIARALRAFERVRSPRKRARPSA